MNSILQQKIHDRDYAGFVAISKLIKKYPSISYRRFLLEDKVGFMLNNSLMVSIDNGTSSADCKIMNDLLFLLPNFVYTFDTRKEFKIREYINGPTIKDIGQHSKILCEIFIQLSLLYEALLRHNDIVHYKKDAFSFDKPNNIILRKSTSMEYCVVFDNTRYTIKPSFIAILPDLNLGNLDLLLPQNMKKDYRNVLSPINNMIELAKLNRAFAEILESIVTIDHGEYICKPFLESPDYLVAEFLGKDEDDVLDRIAKCIDIPRDYVSCMYYIKSLSLLPQTESIREKIAQIESRKPSDKDVAKTLLEDLHKPVKPLIVLEPLSDKYIDGLLSITTNQETMANIGNGQVWDRKKLSEKVEANVQDSKIDVRLRKYYHWVLLSGETVVGYVGLHPMIGAHDDTLQLRIIVSEKERGKNYGTKSVKEVLKMENVSIPFNICALVSQKNKASMRIMQKAGMLDYLFRHLIKGESYHEFQCIKKPKIFILPHDPGFQYEPLRKYFVDRGYVEGNIKTSINVDFIWGNPNMQFFPTSCNFITYFDNLDVITNGYKFRNAMRTFFPDIPVTSSSDKLSEKTLRIYFGVRKRYQSFRIFLWDRAELIVHNKPSRIDNINTDDSQLGKILYAMHFLVKISACDAKILKRSDSLQVFSADIEVEEGDKLRLRKVVPYNNYVYGTGALSFSSFFFSWIIHMISVDATPSYPEKHLERAGGYFGNYYNYYDLAKRELPFIIEYPYLKYYTSYSTLIDVFNQLKKYKCTISEEAYSLHNIRLPNPSYLKFDGRYRRIISSKIEPVGMLSDFFVEDIRVHCKFLKNPSIYDYYNDNIDFVVDSLKAQGMPINIKEMREFLWQSKVRQCTTFKPKLIKYIIELFKSRRVLDISSGWGDRLIGAMASDIDLYHGYDPNLQLSRRYAEIIEFFKLQAVNPFVECIVKSAPFEDAKLERGFYDLVMSSPPYFNMEIYTDTPGQSTESVTTEENWYNNYLWKWLENSRRALRKGGILALNINQERDKRYVNWVIEDLDTVDSGFKYLGMIGYSNEDGKNPQPIFIWRRV